MAVPCWSITPWLLVSGAAYPSICWSPSNHIALQLQQRSALGQTGKGPAAWCYRHSQTLQSMSWRTKCSRDYRTGMQSAARYPRVHIHSLRINLFIYGKMRSIDFSLSYATIANDPAENQQRSSHRHMEQRLQWWSLKFVPDLINLPFYILLTMNTIIVPLFTVYISVSWESR